MDSKEVKPKNLRETTIYLDKNYNTAMFNREIILADSLSFSPYFPCFPRVFPFPPFPGSSKKSHEAWHHPPASSWLMETAVCKVLAGGSWEPGSISTCSHLRCWVIGGDFNGFQWISMDFRCPRWDDWDDFIQVWWRFQERPKILRPLRPRRWKVFPPTFNR